MSTLEGKDDQLSEIQQSLNLSLLFQFVVKIENGKTSRMHFNAEILSFISCVDAKIDINFYV